MPRKLAIEISSEEARVLLLSVSESRITVEQSFVVPLGNGEEVKGESNADKTPISVEQAVVDALSKNGISRLETIAVVGRADVELRLLSIPKVPDAELPDIVRFQAMQEMAGMDDKTSLDYLPLGESATSAESQRVLAAVLKPGVMDRLEKICHDAKLTLARIVLRPTSTASLMLRQLPELRDGCCLLVEIHGRQVEFAALHRGQAVLLRHILLPDNPLQSSPAATSLSDEIRRTRMIVANQENIASVEPVVFVGNDSQHEAFAKRLAAESGIETRLIEALPQSMDGDPQEVVSADEINRFAGLLGALADEAEHVSHAFDFLHPRRPPVPPNRRNTFVLAGLAVATAVLALIVLNWLQTSRLKADIRRLRQEAVALQPEVKKGDKLVADSDKIKDWLAGEVVWLEELGWLSERFPDAKDAMLTNLNAASNGRRREMRLNGFARDIDTASKLDSGLRDVTHQVVGKTKNDNSSENGYTIQFRSSVQIAQPK